MQQKLLKNKIIFLVGTAWRCVGVASKYYKNSFITMRGLCFPGALEVTIHEFATKTTQNGTFPLTITIMP